MNQTVTIHANFPGGNILLEKMSGSDVWLRQDLRDTAGDWFYWAFCVEGAAGQSMHFHFTAGDVIGVRGPAVSCDEGKSWRWLPNVVEARECKGAIFSYDFSPQHTKVLFAFCPIYTQLHFDRFLQQYPKNFYRKEVLCQSRQGKDVELLRIGNPLSTVKVLFTSRHHCCEAMASYCLEGILETILGDDKLGNWLCGNIDFSVVPFMDKDGVEAGDQGKNRKPHDHNRDYSLSIYPEVAALRHWAQRWFEEKRTGIAIDLHCPYIRGNRNEEVYFVGGPDQRLWQMVSDFSSVWERMQVGPIPFDASNNLPFGCEWNTIDNYGAGKSCSKWAGELPDMHLAATLEVPYANAGGTEVNPQSCRKLGVDLITALSSYLRGRRNLW